jgi:hypothetical protein
MTLAIIGVTFGGAFLGGVAGFWIGLQEGGDFNFAPALYGPIGALIGGGIGVVVGSSVFA